VREQERKEEGNRKRSRAGVIEDQEGTGRGGLGESRVGDAGGLRERGGGKRAGGSRSRIGGHNERQGEVMEERKTESKA
jgi:hypothetical protein